MMMTARCGGRKFCSHAIAVAEHLNCLQEFVQALQKSTPECNLTNLVTTITDRRKAGTKSGAPKKGRKGSVSTPITTYNSRLEDVSPALDEVSDTSGECSSSVSPGASPFLVKLLNNRIKKCRGCNRNPEKLMVLPQMLL